MKRMHFLVLALILFPFSQVFPHARIVNSGNLVPRSNSPGLKTGPCGGVQRSQNPTILLRGSSLEVQWEETINHPGRFEFYFSPGGDQNFVLLQTVPDTQNDNNDLPHQYTTTLQLPDMECSDCTIQMIQVMTENPAMPSNYYSCADIELRSDINTPPVDDPPPPPPNSDPPPSPAPDNCEH